VQQEERWMWKQRRGTSYINSGQIQVKRRRMKEFSAIPALVSDTGIRIWIWRMMLGILEMDRGGSCFEKEGRGRAAIVESRE
jgi:hypothetical protein